MGTVGSVVGREPEVDQELLAIKEVVTPTCGGSKFAITKVNDLEAN
jgi:hypothetical protein